jgi:hypothetical protein
MKRSMGGLGESGGREEVLDLGLSASHASADEVGC